MRWTLLGAAALGTLLASTRLGAATAPDVPAPVRSFEDRFRVVGPESAARLGELYAPDVRFQDPIEELRGLDALERYYQSFAERLAGARFDVRHRVLADGEAVLFWTMTLPDGERTIPGVSHMRFGERITEQRDYFDLGQSVYEEVPLLGWFNRQVREQLRE